MNQKGPFSRHPAKNSKATGCVRKPLQNTGFIGTAKFIEQDQTVGNMITYKPAPANDSQNRLEYSPFTLVQPMFPDGKYRF